MKLEHSFTVPTGIDEAWRILLDIELIGPCMPGAAIDSVDGDDFTGTVKVKLGPIGLTYKGKASFIEKDEAAHRAVIDARGRDARGNGTASAKVTAVLEDQGGSTLVKVDTDLDITGKPAQFGRGVMVDVGNKLIGQFANNLSNTISAGSDDAAPADGAAPQSPAAAKTPAAKTAATKTPAAKTPAAKSPAAKTVAAKTAATKTAATKTAATKTAATKTAATKTAATKTAATKTAATKTPAAKGVARPKPSSPAPATDLDADAGEATDEAPVVAEPVTPAGSGAGEPSGVNGHQVRRPVAPVRDVEPINLIESAGPAVAKRLAPVLAALLVLLIVLRRRAKN